MPYPQLLQQDLIDMWALVVLQHNKCLEALTTSDRDLAREVILIEERVNSCEQLIEAHCRRYLAGGAAKESGVGRAMFSLKTAGHLVAIGEQGEKMAEDILHNYKTGARLHADSSLVLAFKSSTSIIDLSRTAFEESDASLLPLLFARINVCRQRIAETKIFLSSQLKTGTDHQVLQFFSITEALAQTVDLSQYIVTSLQNYWQASAVLQ